MPVKKKVGSKKLTEREAIDLFVKALMRYSVNRNPKDEQEMLRIAKEVK